MKKAEALIDELIHKHALPLNYKDLVGDYLWPLVQDMSAIYKKRSALEQYDETPWIVGLQGTQGSGKSTVSLFIKTMLEKCFDYNVVILSIDDFYYTHQERLDLSKTIHPLLCTRGVPGTHDVSLIHKVLQQLADIKTGEHCFIPRFNKAIDDRYEKNEWQKVEDKVDIVIFEGWCMGMPAQSYSALLSPLNELEKNEDEDGRWRQYVNQQLLIEYADVFKYIENLIVLQAPSFKCVYQWRLLQEEKLKKYVEAKDTSDCSSEIRIQSPDQIQRFVSHYERLTRHGLSVLSEEASWVLTLDKAHNMKSLYRNNNLVRLE